MGRGYPARRRGVQADRLRRISIPAPMGSINTISSGAAMPPGDCIFRYNLIPAEYGLRTRLGSREWVTGLGGPVRSLLAFTGSVKSGTRDRLFACTETGIWDVTDSSAAPTQLVVFGTQSADSGWGVSTVMVTAAGHFLLYCDEANGYHVYTESTDTWAKVALGAGAGQVSGCDPANFAFVTTWKNRVWFVERDTGRGWYLPANAIYGAATAFNFGARFKAGGDLRGLWSWTFDGGSGIDDQLVAVSGGGDVLVYQGTDPATLGAFQLRGVWFAGAVPAGRRLCTDFGGDLLLMSSLGILKLSTLVSGSTVSPDAGSYETHKIGNLFNQRQVANRNLRGWSMALHPQDATLIVTVPVAANQPTTQLAMSLWNKGWSEYRDLPMGAHAVPWSGSLYFGSEDGRVLVNDGYIDGVTLADPASYAPVQWSLLTGFQNLGDPRQKRVQLMRPTFLGEAGAPAYEIRARYHWDMGEIAAAPALAPANGIAAWDAAAWDQAVWAAGYSASQRVSGAAGMGPEVAFAIRGSAKARTVLVGVDVAYDVGGFL